jgi:hypothetical protein
MHNAHCQVRCPDRIRTISPCDTLRLTCQGYARMRLSLSAPGTGRHHDEHAQTDQHPHHNTLPCHILSQCNEVMNPGGERIRRSRA